MSDPSAVTVPLAVVSLHVGAAARMASMVGVVVVVLLSQNGQGPCTWAFNDERSMEPLPPVHAFGSVSGSVPSNENAHSCASRSTVTRRSWPGQLES